MVKLYDHRGREMSASSGDAYEGAGIGASGELAPWMPGNMMPDAALSPGHQLGNARAEDMTRNHGIASGGVQLHVDHIVGSNFRLSLKPLYRRLGISRDEAQAWAQDVEAAWFEVADDEINCYLDAERRRTFTMMIREGVATHTKLGEIMAVSQWISRRNSLNRTAIKMISPHRVSNPNNAPDSADLRMGVELNRHGAARAYHVKDPEYGLMSGAWGGNWRRVPRETRWGRQWFLHVFEPSGDNNCRGINTFMSVLSRLKMLDRFQDTQLQNAIVNAMYAAVIQADMGSELAYQLIGGGETDKLKKWMQQMTAYHKGANIKLGGVKVPHLMPGEELKMMKGGNSASGFADFERAILRYIAAGMNVGYEQLARDYTQTNYSSARASMLETFRYMTGRRKTIASRFATQIFNLWLEDMISAGHLRLPGRRTFADYMNQQTAWAHCQWIGSGMLQIDEIKEVNAAIARINNGLSTYEIEAAKMGHDWQDLMEQQAREIQERKKRGLPLPDWYKEAESALYTEEEEEAA